MDSAAEIVGKVQGDLSVKVYQAMDFGTNIGRILVRSLFSTMLALTKMRLQCRRGGCRCDTSLQRNILRKRGLSP